MVVHTSPDTHPTISKEERQFIESSIAESDDQAEVNNAVQNYFKWYSAKQMSEGRTKENKIKTREFELMWSFRIFLI